MLINADKCTGCKLCLEYCPINAIHMENKIARINLDACAECGCCKRSNVCIAKAFEVVKLDWPRSVRAMFSDTFFQFEETKVNGRGTEEMKTNDVTGRFETNDIGFSVDMGRPGVGTRLRELEKVTQAVAKLGVTFEKGNPTTALLIKNIETGELKPEIRNENILSAVVEFVVTPDKVLDVIAVLEHVSQEIRTVFSLGVIGRVNADGSIPIRSLLESENKYVRPNGKTNLGMGRPFVP